MHSRKRTLLLVNPGAGRGEETLAPVIDRFRRSGLQVTLESFEALPALRQDIDRLRSTHDQLVICGGDGSISSAAGAVMESGLPMGILPMGTANDLARTLQIPLELEEAAGVILAGRLRPIDVGTVNGHTFFNIASIGLSTELARRLDARMKRRFGRLSYALTAIQVLLSARRFRARIAANGHSRTVKTYQIAVGNGVHYGGGNVISQAAAIDDGRLDLYSLEMRSLWKLVLMFPAFRAGRHGAWKEVRTARSDAFVIETRRPLPVNADGEIVTTTPARFRTHPGAVSVFVP
ncbi:lipid kinase [Chelativorans composti]|jgi:lipid kinase, YegS/Rv2252/BmrU family|uniref:Lipid kinase n=1 Tax=Chelativorans composti TaxID=768533 RepID=A0ABW5DL41_9HYPH